MAHIRKGVMVAPRERAKHLRRGKRHYWRRHRKAEKRAIKQGE